MTFKDNSENDSGIKNEKHQQQKKSHMRTNSQTNSDMRKKDYKIFVNKDSSHENSKDKKKQIA